MKYSEKLTLEIFLTSYDYQHSFKEVILDIEENYDENCEIVSSVWAMTRYDLTTLMIEIEEVISKLMENMSKSKD